MDASLQLEPVILKDFVEYYASSRYGRIGELPTVYSIATVWYRFVGYQNRLTKSKLDRQVVNDVGAVNSQDSLLGVTSINISHSLLGGLYSRNLI